MRIFVLIFILLATPLFAGVEIKGSMMSANIKAEPLRQVLDRLKQQTGISISLDNELASQTVTANFQDLPIAAGIKKMLEGTGINYAVVSDGEGKPNAVFIGMSAKAGAAPKKLDTRPPMNTRGVVTPVNTYPTPQPSVAAPSNPQPASIQNPPTPVTGFGSNNVVTGGGAPTSVTPMSTGVAPGTAITSSPSVINPSSPASSNPVKSVPPVPTKGTQGNSVPTAGGFVPNTQQPQVVPPKQPDVRPGNVVVPPDVNDEDDDDDDEE